MDPTNGSPGEVPENCLPGVLPVLERLLSETDQSETISAVLSADAMHILQGFMDDGSWGCGYQNGLQVIWSLCAQDPAVYGTLFHPSTQGSYPGVRRLQGWIAEAWHAGFDQGGQRALRGKILDTSQRIGVCDLYSMFSYLGVR